MNLKKLVRMLEETLLNKKYLDSFGFACLFGSLNLKTDIDLFIVPDKKERKGLFLKLLVSFLEEIKRALKKEGYSLLVVNYSVYEDELKYISRKSKKQIVLHVSSYPDVKPCPIKVLLDHLRNPKNRITLKGDFRSVEELRATKYDYYYNYLYLANVLLANYPNI